MSANSVHDVNHIAYMLDKTRHERNRAEEEAERLRDQNARYRKVLHEVVVLMSGSAPCAPMTDEMVLEHARRVLMECQ